MTMMPCSFRVVTEPRYARGGLAQAAQNVADAGRNGDSVVVHLSPEEFDYLRQEWGEPTTNPQTGLPEYFKLRDAFRAVAPFVPLAANVFAPGAVASLGSYFAGDKLAPFVGSALLGAGTGALANGMQGALGGAMAGAGSAALAPGLREAVAGTGLGDALGIASAGRAQGASPSFLRGGTGERMTFPGSEGAAAPKASPAGGKSSLLGPLLGGMGILTGAQMMSRPRQQAAPALPAAPGSNFRPVNYNLGSKAVVGNNPDWYRYGQRPQTDATDPQFMQRTWTQEPVAAAHGGSISAGPLALLAQGGAERAQGPVAGPGTGRSDEIPARLSDGEYVIDAETVALLGDGSSDAGAKALDQFRENIRAHKGGALSHGKISPDAKSPEQYLGRRK